MDFNKLESMVAAAKNGDCISMEWIIEEYNPFIMKMANTTFIPNMDKEDIKQELIHSIILAIYKYNGTNSFFWYAIKTMENNIYTKLKKYKKNDNNINIDSTVICDESNVEDNIMYEVEKHELLEAFNKLKDTDRELLTKIYLENYSYQELSELYNCKYSTISKRKQYALKRLRNHIRAS